MSNKCQKIQEFVHNKRTQIIDFEIQALQPPNKVELINVVFICIDLISRAHKSVINLY